MTDGVAAAERELRALESELKDAWSLTMTELVDRLSSVTARAKSIKNRIRRLRYNEKRRERRRGARS